MTRAPGPIGPQARDTVHRGWLLAGWVTATTAAVGSLIALARIQPGTYSGVVKGFAVFWYVLIVALAFVMTMAAFSYFWSRDR